MTSNAAHERFTIRQKVTMMVNRYEIRSVDASGAEGPLVAVAQQKRMAFKEQVTFYADEARTQPVFGFKARQRMDLGATYDVTDASGTPIGTFRKEFGKSMLRSTWQLTSSDGLQATGTERNHKVAIARRLWDFVPFINDLPSPFVFHFDFTAPDGSTGGSAPRWLSRWTPCRAARPQGIGQGKNARQKSPAPRSHPPVRCHTPQNVKQATI